MHTNDLFLMPTVNLTRYYFLEFKFE